MVWFLQENKTRRSCCRRFVLLVFLGQREGQRAAHQGFFKGTQNLHLFIFSHSRKHTHARTTPVQTYTIHLRCGKSNKNYFLVNKRKFFPKWKFSFKIKFQKLKFPQNIFTYFFIFLSWFFFRWRFFVNYIIVLLSFEGKRCSQPVPESSFFSSNFSELYNTMKWRFS